MIYDPKAQEYVFEFGVRKFGPWNQWFAWFPVRINNKLTWCTTVMRRQTWLQGIHRTTSYRYGPIFDILLSANNEQ